MKRISVSDNFYLDEFIHPVIYKQFESASIWYLNPQLVKLVQAIRETYGEPIYINTWATGGKLKNSGLRDYKNPLGKLNRSRHYYGLCADLHTKDIKKLQQHVADNAAYYFEFGLRVIEDFKYTKTWLHVSVENTELNNVRYIKP